MKFIIKFLRKRLIKKWQKDETLPMKAMFVVCYRYGNYDIDQMNDAFLHDKHLQDIIKSPESIINFLERYNLSLDDFYCANEKGFEEYLKENYPEIYNDEDKRIKQVIVKKK